MIKELLQKLNPWGTRASGERTAGAPAGNADTEARASAILEKIAADLAGIPGTPEQRREVFNAVLVEMSNAAGVSMDGQTVSTTLKDQAPATGRIADSLGTKATFFRSSVSLYPFAKPSLGTSGTVVYEDAKTGELQMLLVRRKRDNNGASWMYPAGYMEVLPESDRIVSDRTSKETRSLLEEKTVGNGPGASTEATASRPLKVTYVPRAAEIKRVLDPQFRALLAEKGWEEADTLMNDAAYVRDVLHKNGLEIPRGVDVTMKENYTRELREESGLSLDAFPEAKTHFVRAGMSLMYSSGAQRSYTANPHYLTDLGKLDAPPALKPEDKEIVEAAWVPVKNIQRTPDGGYQVTAREGEESRPLSAYTAPVIEQSLHALLSDRIKAATDDQLGTPANVQASLKGWTGKLQLASASPEEKALAEQVLAEPLSSQGSLKALVGEEGQKRMRDVVQAAKFLSRPLPERQFSAGMEQTVQTR